MQYKKDLYHIFPSSEETVVTVPMEADENGNVVDTSTSEERDMRFNIRKRPIL